MRREHHNSCQGRVHTGRPGRPHPIRDRETPFEGAGNHGSGVSEAPRYQSRAPVSSRGHPGRCRGCKQAQSRTDRIPTTQRKTPTTMHCEARNARAVSQEASRTISNKRNSHGTKVRRARMHIVLSSILLIVCAAATVSGQPSPPKIDVTKLGPQAGERIADFRLQDQNGKGWTRDALIGPNGLMLVFSRSADWCVLQDPTGRAAGAPARTQAERAGVGGDHL